MTMISSEVFRRLSIYTVMPMHVSQSGTPTGSTWLLFASPTMSSKKVRSVERELTAEEKKKAKAIAKSREVGQMDMFDMLQEVEQTEEDF